MTDTITDEGLEAVEAFFTKEAKAATERLCAAIVDQVGSRPESLLELAEQAINRAIRATVADILIKGRRAVNAERAHRDLISAPRPLGRFASETHDEKIRRAREFRDRMAKEIGL